MADYETPQIMEWLSPLEPYARHQVVCGDRIDGIGDWVLQTEEFREWSDSGGGPARNVLFCYGEPGVGKTYLSSLVLDHLSLQGGEGVVVAGLYYDFVAQKEHSPTHMVGAILKQVIGTRDPREYIDHGFSGRALGLPDLERMLNKAVSSLQRVFICIDGLDECLAEHRALLLESLREIQCLQGVRIFLTGRRSIRDEIEEHLGEVDAIPVDPNINDVMKFAKSKLDKDTKHHATDNRLKEDIMKDVPGKVSENFLVASLVMDLILSGPTILGRRKTLKEMTEAQSLDEAYTATLKHMRAERGTNAGVGIEALMLVSHSERPLQVGELCHAPRVNTGRNGQAVYVILPIQKLLECALGLVAVEDPSSTVRLVHHTLQEYLLHHPDVFMRSHSMMARGCIEYLIHRCANSNLSPTAIVGVPAFANYASCYWGVHAIKGDIEGIKPLALRLLNQYDTHISPRLLLMASDYWPYYAPLGNPFKGFSALHCVALFGIAGLIAALGEERRGNVNGRDAFGATPLLWASRTGSLEGVRALLEWAGVNPNLADSEGQTPLSVAAINGHDEIVKLLLTRDDVDPSGASGGFCWVPLVLAVSGGHEAIVKALLARGDVNPNQLESILGRTPLSRAVEAGHKGIVRLLLGREDIDPNCLEKGCDQTPLSSAAASGHREIVELLLARGDLSSGIAQEAFKQAADHGHDEIVNLLLTREDVNPNARNVSGGTPLSWAAEKGHVGVVKLLLARGDVNPNGLEKGCSQTPLSLAAANGHQEIVGLLLERGDLNPGVGQEAFKQAADHGHGGIVNLLLTREDVNPNSRDTSGRTPLSWAAERGHEEVVRLLASQDEVDPDSADLGGRTPLSWAAQGGHEGTVELLLALNDVDTQAVDLRGYSPLLCAAGNAQEQIVKLLLSRAGVWPCLAREWSRLIVQRASWEEADEGQDSSQHPGKTSVPATVLWTLSGRK